MKSNGLVELNIFSFPSSTKSNFFEKRVAEYQKAGVTSESDSRKNFSLSEEF